MCQPANIFKLFKGPFFPLDPSVKNYDVIYYNDLESRLIFMGFYMAYIIAYHPINIIPDISIRG